MRIRHWLILGGPILLGGYASTGLTVLQPDEVGVVQRLGAVLPEPWEPGLHLGLPWGLDRLHRLKVNQTRTIVVGAAGTRDAPLTRAPDGASGDLLTGDLNMVTAEALVQYRIRDPLLYLFRTVDAESTLRSSSEWALIRALARRGIDELLTTGRAEVAESMRNAIQSLSDQEGLGVLVMAVRLGRVAPPAAVAAAFADADRARSDRRQAITRAEQYRDRRRSEARGQAREIADSAAGQFERLVQPARGEAERFTRVLAEARNFPGPFRRRHFLEALSDLLPRLKRKVIVAAGQDLDLSVFDDEAKRGAGDGDARSASTGAGP
jgi:modulator of FtsH protease HflK